MDVASESSTKVYDGSNCSEDAFRFENLLQNWTLDTFQFIINSSQSQTSMLFSTYSWEIFDKVFEYSLSSTACSSKVLLKTVELIASNNRPRELYMMVVEKIVGTGCGLEPSCLLILLFSMQLALATQPFSPFMRDGLPLVYKAILDSAAGASAASSFTSAETLTDSHDSRRSAITGIALGFCEGLAGR